MLILCRASVARHPHPLSDCGVPHWPRTGTCRASLHGEDAIQLEHVTNDQLVELEKTLRKRLYFEIDKTRSSNRASRIQTCGGVATLSSAVLSFSCCGCCPACLPLARTAC
jgi:hypothetical protein